MKNLYARLGTGLSMFSAIAVPLATNAAIGSGLTNANVALGASQTSSTLTSASDVPAMVGKAISVLLGVLGIVFVVLVVYAGFLYLTSNGDETNVKKAKKMLTQAVIGLVLIVSAYAISGHVIAALTKITT